MRISQNPPTLLGVGWRRRVFIPAPFFLWSICGVGVKLQKESSRVKFEAATPADGRHSMESVLLFLNVVLLQSVEIGIFQKERSRVQVGICHKSMYCRRSNSSMESVILSHLCDTFFAVTIYFTLRSRNYGPSQRIGTTYFIRKIVSSPSV